jgi:hypothetical protein
VRDGRGSEVSFSFLYGNGIIEFSRFSMEVCGETLRERVGGV